MGGISNINKTYRFLKIYEISFTADDHNAAERHNVSHLHLYRYIPQSSLAYYGTHGAFVTNLGCVRVWGANITQWRTKHNPWRYNCLINFRWLYINDYIRPATTGDFIHILHSITLSYNTRRAHGRPLLQILLTTDGLISTTGHSRRRYTATVTQYVHNMYTICTSPQITLINARSCAMTNTGHI